MTSKTILAPQNEDDLAACIKAAVANQSPLDISGGNSRSGLGRPACDHHQKLSTVNLAGIIEYEPSELVLTARAGTPLPEIEALLKKHNQELAFEPLNHAALYPLPDTSKQLPPTLGGMIAVNASGPRRIKAGAARDHLLGFRAITGRGEAIHSGGQVMKNVTGYDLSKLMCGAFGTLGILTELSIKVMPVAETQRTLLVAGLADETAINILTKASGMPFEVSGLAHLPAGLIQKDEVPSLPAHLTQQNLTALRLEGPDISVRQREADLQTALEQELHALTSQPAEFTGLAPEASEKLWASLRDVTPFHGTHDQIWRISTPPATGAKLVQNLMQEHNSITGYYYDWAGGLIWVRQSPLDSARHDLVRSAVNSFGGHATLVRAENHVRSRLPVFHPQPEALAALSGRIRRNFDPELILNRGRMREDL